LEAEDEFLDVAAINAENVWCTPAALDHVVGKLGERLEVSDHRDAATALDAEMALKPLPKGLPEVRERMAQRRMRHGPQE
jgi:hypothetical protein